MRWVGRSPNVGGGVGVKNSIFGFFRSPAPKLALVPGSRWYYDIDIWYTQVCGKCHQDLKRMRWVARSPNVTGGVKNSIFGSFRSPAPKQVLVPGSR